MHKIYLLVLNVNISWKLKYASFHNFMSKDQTSSFSKPKMF